MLLGVSDVFCTSIEDLRIPAKGEPFEILTGTSRPIKQRPFRLAPREMGWLDATIAS